MNIRGGREIKGPRTQGQVVPDSFTHGTSEQRMRWFRRGVETGDLASCDTFNAGAV